MSDLRRLLTWLARAQPPRRALVRALVSGIIGTLSAVALSVGALALLVESARRPGLAAVAGLLIAIELLAFLRSPIRYGERMSAHRLGLAAVTRWRRWLVVAMGAWSYRRWQSRASGDLLERSLRDTDELQDLWLRGAVPVVSSVATALIGDVAVGLLPGGPAWWFSAGLVALCQLGTALLLLGAYPGLVRADRVVRERRGAYRAVLVEIGAAAPELSLLGRDDFAQARADGASAELQRAERNARRASRTLGPITALAPVGALFAVLATHPSAAPLWLVVAALLAAASAEYAATWRDALATAVAVSGAAERLDDLEVGTEPASGAWPTSSPGLRLEDVVVEIGDTRVERVHLDVARHRHVALVGPSGSGKSAVLRVVAGLDVPSSGRALVGDAAIASISEGALRTHVAYVSAEPGLTSGFVRDVIAMGRPLARDYVDDLAAVGIEVTPDTRWGELSRGERQRVALVRALATSPDFVVLDEPTSGLGPRESAQVIALLERSGAGVLVATHDESVMAWCDTVVAIEESQTATR